MLHADKLDNSAAKLRTMQAQVQPDPLKAAAVPLRAVVVSTAIPVEQLKYHRPPVYVQTYEQLRWLCRGAIKQILLFVENTPKELGKAMAEMELDAGKQVIAKCNTIKQISGADTATALTGHDNEL